MRSANTFSRRWWIKEKTHYFHILDGRQNSLHVGMLFNEHLLDCVAEELLGCPHCGFARLVEQLLADPIQAAFQKTLKR